MDVFITLGSFVPFMVCLCWLTTFLLNSKKNDEAKRVLTLFLAVSTVLYFCHGVYFNLGLSTWLEALWALCSLSVYPLYYIYICSLTTPTLRLRKMWLILVPGLLVAVAKLLFPGEESDLARKILFAVQVFVVCYLGYRRLQAFDREIAEVYADTEGRDVSAVRHLLIAFFITAVCSSMANAIGKRFFAEHGWTILVVMIPFAVMLFILSYIGFMRDFTFEQYVEDQKEDLDSESNAGEATDELIVRIERLMQEEQIYLQKNLKITDVARRLDVCRTYVSKCINESIGQSFSDYINSLRVEQAKQLILESDNKKLLAIADMVGFSSERSFYRCFKQFTGLTPLQWEKREKEK